MVFAQGPIGLCATLGARLRGAALIIGVIASPSSSPCPALRSQCRD
jgi:threonine dehydrogenase-like Zn-dependent dehydrogenase